MTLNEPYLLSDLSTDRWAQEWMHLSLLFLVKKSIDLVHIAFKKHPGASAHYGVSCWVKLSIIYIYKFPRISDVGYWILSSSSDWPITHTTITISYSIDLGVLIPRYVKKGKCQYTEMISPIFDYLSCSSLDWNGNVFCCLALTLTDSLNFLAFSKY